MLCSGTCKWKHAKGNTDDKISGPTKAIVCNYFVPSRRLLEHRGWFTPFVFTSATMSVRRHTSGNMCKHFLLMPTLYIVRIWIGICAGSLLEGKLDRIFTIRHQEFFLIPPSGVYACVISLFKTVRGSQ